MKIVVAFVVVLLLTGTAWGEEERRVDPNLTVRPLKPELTPDDFKMARAKCIEKNQALEAPSHIPLAGNGVRWLIDRFDNCMMAEGFEMIRKPLPQLSK